MQVFANVILGISAFLVLCLSVVVIANGSKDKLNKLLFGFFVFTFIWIATNIGANVSANPDTSLLFARLTMAGAAFMPLFFLLFAKELYGVKTSSRGLLLLTLPSILMFASLPTELNIVSIGPYGADTELGVIYTFLILVYIVYFARAIQLLIRLTKSGSALRASQARLILTGIVLALIPSLVTNAILPLVGLSSAVYFGPASVVFLVVTTSLAIIRHRLFNIRLIVTRAIAYGGLLVFILLMYAAVGLTVSRYLEESLDNRFASDAALFISTILIAVLYSPTKLFIDKQTNRLFYRDAYDPQTLISKLNQTLVADVDLESILEKTSKIIEEQLKASYCGFYIRETSYFPSRFIGDYNKKIPEGDLEKIRQVTPLISSKVVSTDLEPTNNEETMLSELLKKNDIEVLGRLVSTLEYKVAGVGYMILGPKQSGGSYSKQDIRLLEILTNELVLAVENALRLEEIEQFNVTLQKKIDGATKELKDNNEKLKALDIAKDEFVSMASHQLRTPLTSIKGYISMVLEGDAGKINDQQKKMLGQAFFSSQRMVYLISDLLNISRLRTGKFIIESKPTDLADLIQSELKQLEEGAAAKNLTMTYKKPKSFPIMNLDDMKIRQVVMNFVDNALYYTPQNGEITIELKEKPRSVEFTVKDSGIGVPKKEQHKLFTKFYRADNARKARPDGTGIGLFMAKKIIATSGGSIIFHSKEGKGSTFGFSFPKKGMVIEEKNA